MEEEVEFTLPKTLHFIWIGDSIIKKYMRNILLFAERNPSYKARLINNNKSKMSLAAKYVCFQVYLWVENTFSTVNKIPDTISVQKINKLDISYDIDYKFKILFQIKFFKH